MGLLLAGLTGTPVVANSQSISGEARAGDGDSLEVGGRRVRLVGIDAPELDQTCDRSGTTWRCGEDAKAFLASLVAGQRVDCQGQGSDQYARVLAVCWAGRTEINRVLVEQGWATAFRRYSDAYAADELRAKAQHLGIWNSTFVSPGDYRLAKLPPVPRSAQVRAAPVSRPVSSYSGGCLIKGNHSRRGEWIYHLPGMPYYEQTRAEEMFCSEADAVAAGYRRSRAAP